MYSFVYTNSFLKDIKKLTKAGSLDVKSFNSLLDLLETNKALPIKYKNHPLKGNLLGYFDCHLKDNIVLLYKKNNKEKTIILARIGTHADVLNV